MFLITAFPRSGTQYISQLFAAIGHDVPHEKPGQHSDGVVSWFHAADGGFLPFAGEIVSLKSFNPILHQTRHPLKAIASAQTLKDDSYQFMFRKIGHPGGDRSIRWGMWCWLKWNELIERFADYQYRIEDIEKELPIICQKAGIDQPKYFPEIQKFANTRPHDILTWKDLRSKDHCLAGLIKEKAYKYGYQLIQNNPDQLSIPKISVVMMMKNEAEQLPRCLKSVREIADEIIIVDTGSEDDSIKIAESYGAKIYRHPWEDDFSKHRNQSVDYATGDWLLQIDCDEQFYCDDPIAFKRWLAAVPPEQNGVSISLMDVSKLDRDEPFDVYEKKLEFNATRVFRNGKVRFKGIVHNYPEFGNDAAWLYNAAHIKHYGYDLPPEKIAAKHERTISLLKRRILKNSDDYHAYFLLNQFYGSKGEIDNAIEYGEKYLKFKDRDPEFNPSIYYSMVTFYLGKKQYDKARDLLAIACKALPDDVDLAFGLTRLGMETGNPDIIVEGASRFLRNYQLLKRNPAKKQGRFIYEFNPGNLIFCLFHLTLIKMKESIYCLNLIGETMKEVDEEFQEFTIKDLTRELALIFNDNKNGGDICHLILTGLKQPIGNRGPKKSR